MLETVDAIEEAIRAQADKCGSVCRTPAENRDNALSVCLLVLARNMLLSAECDDDGGDDE